MAIALWAAAAGLGTVSMRQSQDRLSECLSKTIAFAGNVDLARDAQVHFKRQVQEWKDVLLRGHKPADYAKYWSLYLPGRARATRSASSRATWPFETELGTVRDVADGQAERTARARGGGAIGHAPLRRGSRTSGRG